MTNESTREKLLDAAERRAREGGYHAFSFRELAADIGIKSASVHYHFPTKPALGVALVERYAAEALGAIGTPQTPLQAFERVASLFRSAARDAGRMCLCGMFAAERDGLPEEVAQATRAYFTKLLRVMADVDASAATSAPHRPETLLAALEGALLLARATDDPSALERVIEDLRAGYDDPSARGGDFSRGSPL